MRRVFRVVRPAVWAVFLVVVVVVVAQNVDDDDDNKSQKTRRLRTNLLKSTSGLAKGAFAAYEKKQTEATARHHKEMMMMRSHHQDRQSSTRQPASFHAPEVALSTLVRRGLLDSAENWADESFEYLRELAAFRFDGSDWRGIEHTFLSPERARKLPASFGVDIGVRPGANGTRALCAFARRAVDVLARSPRVKRFALTTFFDSASVNVFRKVSRRNTLTEAEAECAVDPLRPTVSYRKAIIDLARHPKLAAWFCVWPDRVAPFALTLKKLVAVPVGLSRAALGRFHDCCAFESEASSSEQPSSSSSSSSSSEEEETSRDHSRQETTDKKKKKKTDDRHPAKTTRSALVAVGRGDRVAKEWVKRWPAAFPVFQFDFQKQTYLSALASASFVALGEKDAIFSDALAFGAVPVVSAASPSALLLRGLPHVLVSSSSSSDDVAHAKHHHKDASSSLSSSSSDGGRLDPSALLAWRRQRLVPSANFSLAPLTKRYWRDRYRDALAATAPLTPFAARKQDLDHHQRAAAARRRPTTTTTTGGRGVTVDPAASSRHAPSKKKHHNNKGAPPSWNKAEEPPAQEQQQQQKPAQRPPASLSRRDKDTDEADGVASERQKKKHKPPRRKPLESPTPDVKETSNSERPSSSSSSSNEKDDDASPDKGAEGGSEDDDEAESSSSSFSATPKTRPRRRPPISFNAAVSGAVASLFGPNGAQSRGL